MCDFGNGKTPDFFGHPALRAIILHFWLAYDHPFVDGNGRTARALFYWGMLNAGYWLFEFISISNILRKAPIKYGRSFLYSETDLLGGNALRREHHTGKVCSDHKIGIGGNRFQGRRSGHENDDDWIER
jgi:Fic family protein